MLCIFSHRFLMARLFYAISSTQFSVFAIWFWTIRLNHRKFSPKSANFILCFSVEVVWMLFEKRVLRNFNWFTLDDDARLLFQCNDVDRVYQSKAFSRIFASIAHEIQMKFEHEHWATHCKSGKMSAPKKTRKQIEKFK